MDHSLATPLDASNLARIQTLKQHYQLTDRETELVAKMLSGLSLAESAEYMCISKETVRFHLKNIFHKTKTHSQKALILLALR